MIEDEMVKKETIGIIGKKKNHKAQKRSESPTKKRYWCQSFKAIKMWKELLTNSDEVVKWNEMEVEVMKWNEMEVEERNGSRSDKVE
ncbi:unnamed protein product [Rhizophagus irregularis]|nr:unnamed protein product [Rhizophagus irregularis]CAB5321553.1 unnamed protein product [Rhizophagus irregularis]